ncbi:SIR2 family protein [Methanosarcina barkeri]|uniref:SIR2/CHAT domain-containing protein n=1 Tax=Methanosarcina barkeri CM1 TaxID=796385 RepID=A0A0G3CDT7_METBA|nr:SIR2 family protein [Methanosarcina barkeri]AKJ37257.1 SIR2/CHAT domain-containing protein [Methanosarcina barkeri CM1]
MSNKLNEKDWDLLLRRIKDGKCTPFLGAGACSQKIPVGSQIASGWAKDYDYPMKDSDDLTRVAQFVAVITDVMTPKEMVCKKIKEKLKEVAPSYFDNPYELHRVLADLPLPVYITTNYDDFMVQALKNRGKTPIQEYCRWNKNLRKSKQTSSDYVPTPEKPLVFHLHGCYKKPESLVLTEDDYLDFFAANSMEKSLLPPSIQEALTGTSLLFLGYSITDWDFRVLFRILGEYLEISSRRTHLSVQLVPGDVSEAQIEKAQEYLDHYFGKLDIHVYWQDCCEFAKELRTRWEDFNSGIIRKDTENRRPFPIKEKTDKVSILFLAADPTDASRLRLGEEFREIQEKMKLARLRDQFTLELPQLAVRPSDISQALLDTHPQIVHFSGHGTPTGALCFENRVGGTHPITPDALAALFKQFSGQVNCVILNACYSEIQAKAIAKHIKYVIGMNQEIGDKAAIDFAIGFYQALGGGLSIEGAYELGRVQIQMNIPEHLTPTLIKEGSVVNVAAQQNED